ncbi:Endonuclease/exonuclease/phosphatase [Artemisia annua]|uniref:Endonuclease/exonuclease/phosphatase n=1 Tax=Artemisia annua TaxID=35608 RepID=A0A2U1MYP4_ARTAN|nr:Endonuclease/exonuclease/phosphatase [Artemisia annua]
MKALKLIIKEWSKNLNSSQFSEKEDLIKNIKDFDENIERGIGDPSVDSQRALWLANLHAIEFKENLDASQKAKIKWGVEADENSKFFHATINQKRRSLAIHGIMYEGHWLTDPHLIKNAFLTFFESKFQRIDVIDPHLFGFGFHWYVLPFALIQKWRWRFFNNPRALWVQVITAIHGHSEDTSSFSNHVRDQGVWGRIVGSINTMHEKGIVPHSSLKRRVNNGISTKFWTQTWIGNTSLQHQFPRLFRLGHNKDCTIRTVGNRWVGFEWSSFD